MNGPYESVDVSVRAAGLGEWRLLGARLLPGDTLRITAQIEKQPVTMRQPAPATRTNTQTAPTSGSYSAFSTASHTTPPATIRVWVTGSTTCDKTAEGEVQVVDFKEYVKHVLPNEWLGGWPSESLRTGALAAKSYAWYQVNRGGKWPDLGADVMDSTCDQVYNPAVSYASTDQAVEDTWGQRVTRDGKIHISQYWAGTKDDGARPAVDSPYAGRLSQWGSEYWARQGMTWDWILNYYYDNVVISSVTGGDLRLSQGITVSTGSPVWGEPFAASFTVHNYGQESVQLSELYLKLRGPAGEVADLGGDRNATAIAPGTARTLSVRTPALAHSLTGNYGDYTLTATYRDPNGLLVSAIPSGASGTSGVRVLKVLAPSYGAQVVSVSETGPRYFELTQRTVTIKVRNTGNATYRRQSSAALGAVRLGTASPLNRNSRFYVPGPWLLASRIGMGESSVAPGGTATFRVVLSGTPAPGS